MTFRKEDHQAMQSMYHFRIKKAQANEWDLLELVREIPAARRCRSRAATSASRTRGTSRRFPRPLPHAEGRPWPGSILSWRRTA